MKTIALPFLFLLCAPPALAADMVEVRVTGRVIDHRIGVLKNAIILNELPQDLTKFHITHLLPDPPETGVTGFNKSLTSGGIYTKDSFRFRFPFRVKNAEQVRGLTNQPVTFAVTGSKAITGTKYRFVDRNSYFVAEN